MTEHSLAVFEGKQIRRHYDEDAEIWYFSVVDIIQVLIQQPDYQASRNYWKVLKNQDFLGGHVCIKIATGSVKPLVIL